MRFLPTLLASTLGTFIALGIVFFFFFLFVLALASSTNTVPPVRPSSVLIVTLDGPIPEIDARNSFEEALGGQVTFDLRDLVEAFRKAAADARIDAVLVEIKEVSTSWALLGELRAAMRAYRAAGKPLYAYSADYSMAEGGYYLASAADSAFAAPEALFEFNGFYIGAEFYKRLLDRLEVTPQVVRAGTYKSAVEPFLREDLSPENEEQLRAMVEATNRVFIDAVAEARGLSSTTVESLLTTGAVLQTQDASREGLLDGLLYRDEVEALIKARLGHDPDAPLRTVSLKAYRDVPRAQAGLSAGDAGEVAVVYTDGAIVSGQSSSIPNPLLGTTTVGAETFAEAIDEARSSSRVKAIVVRVNSPGGFAPAADAMWRSMRRAADEKPVVVSMGGVAASGGYWIATAADTVVADPLTITGSIGVFSTFFDLSGLWEDKIGITFDAVRTSPYADMFSGMRPFTDAERRLLQASVDSTYRLFLRKVADGRGLPVDSVDALAQGRVWMGATAREIGLVDVLGGLETAVGLAAERAGLEPGTYSVRTLPRPKTMLEELSGSLNARAASAWMNLRTTPAERRLLDQARLLNAATDDHGTLQARLPMNLTIR